MASTVKVGRRMILNLPSMNDDQLKDSLPRDFIPLLLAINKHVAPQALCKRSITTIFNSLLTRSRSISPEERSRMLNSWSTSPDWTDIDKILGVTIPHAELLPDRKIKIEGLVFHLPVVSPTQFLNQNYSPDQFISSFRSSNAKAYGFHILSPEVCQAAMMALPDAYSQASETMKKNFRNRVNGRKGRETLRAYAEEWAERYGVLGPFPPIEGHECTTLLPPIVPDDPIDPVLVEYRKRREEYDQKLREIEEERARLQASMERDLIAAGLIARTF